MELNDLLVTILNTIEMSLALSIGLFLLFLNRKKNNSLLFLGLFLIAIGLSSLSEIFDTINKYVNNPYLELYPLEFFTLIPCLLYVYLGEISIIKQVKKNYYVLVPALIIFVVNVFIYFSPPELREYINESVLYLLLIISSFIYALIIIGLIFRKVRKHSKLLKDQYSYTERRELNWLLVAISAVILFFITSLIAELFFSEFIATLYSSIFGVFLVYWTSYHGLLQQTTENLITENSINHKPIINKKTTNDQSKKDLEKYIKVKEKIDALMVSENLYLNRELTITQISEKIDEHPRLVSTAINKLSEHNFNSYINKFRVEKAKKMLLTGEISQLNIEGIGFESGFKSNSSFYAAFNKFQKITPLDFFKNQKSQ